MKDVVADGLAQPVPIAQLQQADSAALVMGSVSVFRVHLVLGHEVIEVADVLLLHRPAQPAQPASPPLEDENGKGQQEDQEEDASENEQKFS